MDGAQLLARDAGSCRRRTEVVYHESDLLRSRPYAQTDSHGADAPNERVESHEQKTGPFATTALNTKARSTYSKEYDASCAMVELVPEASLVQIWQIRTRSAEPLGRMSSPCCFETALIICRLGRRKWPWNWGQRKGQH